MGHLANLIDSGANLSEFSFRSSLFMTTPQWPEDIERIPLEMQCEELERLEDKTFVSRRILVVDAEIIQ